MSIFAYYFQIIFLTNYISSKIEWHVPSQSTAAKNWEGARAPRLPEAPMIKPLQISKANFAYGSNPKGTHFEYLESQTNVFCMTV